MDQIIAANYLLSLEKCLEQLGFPHFLAKIGFDLRRVQDPSAYVSQQEFAQVIRKAYEISECPQLGLLTGRCLSIVTHGFLGYAAMTSPTMGTAIQMMVSYINTRTNLLKIELHKLKTEYFYVQLDSLLTETDISRFFYEMVVAHLDNMRNFLINATTPLPRIELAYPKPAYATIYEDILKTEIIFNAQHNKVWFAANEFDFPVCYADDASFKLSRKELQALADKISKQEDLPGRIKTILMGLDLLDCSMEEMASKLCMSSRTLRRHLHKDEITYQEIVDEIRQEKAQAYLLNVNMSMTEIGYVLGFHDTSNFSKAFKRWTSLTPSEYRERYAEVTKN